MNRKLGDKRFVVAGPLAKRAMEFAMKTAGLSRAVEMQRSAPDVGGLEGLR